MTKSGGAFQFLHTLESGNPEADIRYIDPFYYENAAIDSRFRGNDEE